MKGRLALAALAGALGSVLAPPANRVIGGTAVTVIKAVPYEGHSGGLIDLSGSGFKPHRQLLIFMACPSWIDPTVYQYHNFVHIYGPTTDAQGEFAGFLFHAPVVSHVAPTIGCQIYVSVPADNQLFAVGVVPATYYIKPAKYKLLPCERAMCVKKVAAAPTRVRAGLTERIRVEGWPGARVDLVLSYANNREVHHTQHLDWRGSYTFTETVPQTSPGDTAVKITVRARLGRMQDTKYGAFTVTR